MKPKGWAGYWEGFHYPTFEEIVASPPPVTSWEEVLVTLLRKNEREQLAMLQEEYSSA